MEVNKLVILVVVVLLGTLVIGLVSFSDVVQLGPASQPKNVSVVVVGADPVVVTVFDGPLAGGVFPLQSSIKTVTFVVNVEDPNGASDIIDNSVSANVSYSLGGEALRRDFLCSPKLGESTQVSKNYTCQIDMEYFDASGYWNITATAVDTGNGTPQQGFGVFNYAELRSIELNSLQPIQFPNLVPGSVNISAVNNPTTVNNTGNYGGSLMLNGINLLGDGPVPNAYLGVDNFSIGTAPGSECLLTSANLLNGTDVVITNINRGNLSLGGGVGQTTLYYCITLVPGSLPAQAYSTTRGGPWFIKI